MFILVTMIMIPTWSSPSFSYSELTRARTRPSPSAATPNSVHFRHYAISVHRGHHRPMRVHTRAGGSNACAARRTDRTVGQRRFGDCAAMGILCGCRVLSAGEDVDLELRRCALSLHFLLRGTYDGFTQLYATKPLGSYRSRRAVTAQSSSSVRALPLASPQFLCLRSSTGYVGYDPTYNTIVVSHQGSVFEYMSVRAP